jgi:hypothetical protein
MEEQLKDNHCQITYRCYSERKKEKCCYHWQSIDLENTHCKCQTRNTCNSAVAQVNRLVLELQRLTGKKIRFEDNE